MLTHARGQGARADVLGDRGGGRAGIAERRSFYAEQVEKFVTLFRSPPGRETYEVVARRSAAGIVG